MSKVKTLLDQSARDSKKLARLYPPDDIDSRDKECSAYLLSYTCGPDCPKHGIAASNARQNRYWQRVGGHD